MTDTAHLTLDEAQALAVRALQSAGVDAANAASTARALVAAEADGQKGHGLSRVPSYALQARVGKVDGHARPTLERAAPAAVRIDGALGFAYPALDMAIEALVPLARTNAIAAAVIRRSHHFGQAGAHAERLAEQGLIALVFGNSPKGMAFWGAAKPRMGTNPIAFASPLPDQPPLVIDLALAQAARGRILAAQQAGHSIPEGWAVDAQGQPTTDPNAALKGAMLPIGGAKGSALALMVEILSAALAGAAFGWEASSLFDDQGGPPDLGQTLLALDPEALSGGAFMSRMAAMVAAIDEDDGARLPGTRRLTARAKAKAEGLVIPAVLHAEIVALAEG
ncbi:Ldh family oxidoreductase [Caulobacter sp. S45]|uniref:Ldh family oxidoreductase n=1 Tax=Caulobacter sp. S45 TaxID=1641861 RepID=UPI00131DC2CA|nr:Ldh family oxidoreductase [Caulobacter sp. S45]